MKAPKRFVCSRCGIPKGEHPQNEDGAPVNAVGNNQGVFVGYELCGRWVPVGPLPEDAK